MSKIEIPTAEMDMGEGAVMRLLLCKDAKKLDMALAHLENNRHRRQPLSSSCTRYVA
jgi:hypothetical protein